ncbi:MAG TPA: gamma-glutamyltransferase [Candidatus Limnocylindrales bacterium]|nr:gamma-glutamyltransferase [Candidatus Limnocylindrales bacterium]
MTTRATVRCVNGLVATDHHLATAAGVAVLQDGGSAVDAAVAAAAVCAVTQPHRTSIGGDLFALVYDSRTREVTAYNGSGAAARSLTRDQFAGGFPTEGAILATVPGVIAAWGDLLGGHGRLGLDRVLAPAIRYAAEGFPVSDALAEGFVDSGARLDEEAARVFGPRGRFPRAGEILQQPDLAETLREVAQKGTDSFYTGELGERLAIGIARAGGAVTIDDLAVHTTDRPDAATVRYRGLTIYGQPPVSQGHILLEELAIAEGLDMSELAWGSADLVHQMVEIKKMAFADRDAYAGDPRAVPFEVTRLFDESFVASRRKAIPGRASDRTDAGFMPADTTYLAVVDRDGNAVSLIESVFSEFGSASIVPGTGVLLNNRLSGFSLDPASQNVLAPGKRPVHTLNTVIALDGVTPRLVFGTPGRHAQVQTNFQLAVGLIDNHFDVQRAIEEPRWYHEAGKALKIESRFSESTRKALSGKGHELTLLGDWAEITGGAQAIAIDENGVFSGGADPRREGHAAGY